MSSDIKKLLDVVRWNPEQNCFWSQEYRRPYPEHNIAALIYKLRLNLDPTIVIEHLKSDESLHYHATKKRIDKQAALKTCYLYLKPYLLDRYRYYGRPDGTIVVFRVNERHEYEQVVNDMKTNAFEFLLSTNREFNSQLVEAFTNCERAAELNKSFSTPAKIINEIFSMFTTDMELLIDHEPQIISWDANVPAYRQLDASLIAPGQTPNWDSFLARVDEPELLLAFIWSIFEPRNRGRQVLWLYGEGNDGKSSMVNAIVNFLGVKFSHAVGKGEYGSDFFFGNIVNKRFVVYSDCSNPNALREERMRQMTGNDVVTVNQKYEKAYAANIHAKVIVTSNLYPKININEKSELSRLILITAKSYARNFGDSDFQENLIKEFPFVLHKAKELYPKYFPTHMNWQMSEAMYKKIQNFSASEDTLVFGKFIETRLEFGENFSVDQLDLKRAFDAFASYHISKDNRINFDNFKNFLAKNHDLEYINKYGKKKELLSTQVKGLKVIGEIV